MAKFEKALENFLLAGNTAEEINSIILNQESRTPEFKQGDTVKIAARSNTHSFKIGTVVTVKDVFTKPYKGFEYYYLIEAIGLEFFVTPDMIEQIDDSNEEVDKSWYDRGSPM